MLNEGHLGGLFILLIMVLWIVKTIEKYPLESALGVGTILTLAILVWSITFILKRRKIRKVRQSDVISIPSQGLFSIPMKVEEHDYKNQKGKLKSRWMVESLRPELNDYNLSFVPMKIKLEKVKVLRSEPEQDVDYQTTKQISSLTKEIFDEINPQLSRFKQRHVKLARLEKLVSGSEMYRSKAQLYKRARILNQQLIEQAENLKREYSKFIREILIGVEIAQFDPNSLSEISARKLILQSKYEEFKTEFQNQKDEINIYDDLKIETSQFSK